MPRIFTSEGIDKSRVSGNVTGPGSSTDHAVVRFDGTSGELIQGSAVIIDDSGNVSGVGTLTMSGALTGATISDVTNVISGGTI